VLNTTGIVGAIVVQEGSEGSPVVSDSSSAVTQCSNHGLRGERESTQVYTQNKCVMCVCVSVCVCLCVCEQTDTLLRLH
jgi:hypothetical protein